MGIKVSLVAAFEWSAKARISAKLPSIAEGYCLAKPSSSITAVDIEHSNE
jgi:hypothetical protein